MRAVVVQRLMEPSGLKVFEQERPELTDDGVRIEIRAAGCNFADILMLKGEYQVKPLLPFIPGSEVAGIITEVADAASGLRSVGDRVLARCGIGGYAEEVVVPASATYRLPETLSFEAGAALPTVYPTSFAALVWRAPIAKGETLLVHAAAGGVGLSAVQIGKARGARVIATAGGEQKLAIARKAGADILIDYRKEDFVDRVLSETDGRGADVIYDSVGGDTCDGPLAQVHCLEGPPAGHRVCERATSPRVKPRIAIMLKNISRDVGLHWSGLRRSASHTWIDECLCSIVRPGECRRADRASSSTATLSTGRRPETALACDLAVAEDRREGRIARSLSRARGGFAIPLIRSSQCGRLATRRTGDLSRNNRPWYLLVEAVRHRQGRCRIGRCSAWPRHRRVAALTGPDAERVVDRRMTNTLPSPMLDPCGRPPAAPGTTFSARSSAYDDLELESSAESRPRTPRRDTAPCGPSGGQSPSLRSPSAPGSPMALRKCFLLLRRA